MLTLDPTLNLQPTLDQKLYWLTQEVLGNWAFLPADPSDFSRSATKPGLEYLASIQGRHGLTVVVCGDLSTGQLLAESATGEKAAPGQAMDAFKELVNLLCGHLQTELLGGQAGHFQPFIPRACLKAEWPAPRPSASCAVDIEGNHMEVHVWLEQEA